MNNKKKFTIEVTVDENKLAGWNYHDQEDVEWLSGELNSGGLINFLNELIEEGGGTDIILNIKEAKDKLSSGEKYKQKLDAYLESSVNERPPFMTKGMRVKTLKFNGRITRFNFEGCYIDTGGIDELREEWVNFEDIIELE